MIDVRRQKKINEVMGSILRGLAYDQHINAVPLQISVGIPEGRGVISNCIMIYSAPQEILRYLPDLEDVFPGVEVKFGFGGAAALIDCEHVVIEPVGGKVLQRVRQLMGGAV